jgi:hypothetical protein
LRVFVGQVGGGRAILVALTHPSSKTNLRAVLMF